MFKIKNNLKLLLSTHLLQNYPVEYLENDYKHFSPYSLQFGSNLNVEHQPPLNDYCHKVLSRELQISEKQTIN